jgi:LmbE family N-acetylglucosaminyl deacetylase
MLALPLLSSIVGRRAEILCVGAHCDDIEIGCAGTLLTLIEALPECRVHWLVLTSTASRRREALAAQCALLPARVRGQLRIANLRDGHLPAHFAAVKREFEQCKRRVNPDLVFTHHEQDRHQDHALISAVTKQTFRDHLLLEYEVLKYDGDMGQPGCYMPLDDAVVARKIAILQRHFPSQSDKPWFDQRNFEGLMRVRGVECRAPTGCAEAFYVRKLTLRA